VAVISPWISGLSDPAADNRERTMFDIKIINGEVLDGSGAPPTVQDIGVTGDRIAGIGDLSRMDSKTVLDAAGKVVCPGFVDAHSHSDAYLLIEPSASSKIYQGITTEVVGNCGASAAPLAGEYRMPAVWCEKGIPGTWSTVAEYRALIEKVRPAPNVVLLIGHNALRAAVAGYENRRMTNAELRGMARFLEQALEEGGRGLSMGLIYAPGRFAAPEELAELAKLTSRHNGIYASHMRNEGKHLLQAIEETVSIGKATGVRVEISHLKISGRGNWELIDEALALIRSARAQGVDVAADRYPYIRAHTDLDVIFPDWAAEGGRDAVLKRLRSASTRKRLKEDLLKSRSEDYWTTITIGSISHPDNKEFQGMTLSEVARRLGIGPVDAVLHLTEADELKTQAFFAGMSERNMLKILAEPYVMIGTDASLRVPTGPLSNDFPHPRAYGSFPRFLRMALDGRTVSLPEAVRKMTSLPADWFRLTGRGILAEKMKADIVIFDPGTVRDTASYSAPHHLAQGIDHVIINGVLTLTYGRLTGKRSGRFL